jgi:hypothetical protein
MKLSELIKATTELQKKYDGDYPVCISCEGHLQEISELLVESKQYLKPSSEVYIPTEKIIIRIR